MSTFNPPLRATWRTLTNTEVAVLVHGAYATDSGLVAFGQTDTGTAFLAAWTTLTFPATTCLRPPEPWGDWHEADGGWRRYRRQGTECQQTYSGHEWSWWREGHLFVRGEGFDSHKEARDACQAYTDEVERV